MRLLCLAWKRSASRNQYGQPFVQLKSSQDPNQTTIPMIEIVPDIPRPQTHIYIYNTIKLYKLYKHSSRSQPKSSRIPPKFTARWHGLGCRVVVERLPVALATATTVLRAGTGQRHWAGGAGGKSPGCRGHDAETLGSSRSLEVPSGKLT